MILKKYTELREKYGFKSMNLGEISESGGENIYV